ncbi:MAG: AI-2E family transporter [Planctomycetota bacterium]|nr:AI-2E family transporter [Planctomycetota bacterium]
MTDMPEKTAPGEVGTPPAAAGLRPDIAGALPCAPRRNTYRLLILCAAGAVVLAFGYHLRAIFNPLLLALLIAYMLNPAVTYFERLKISRTVTILVFYVVLVAAACFALAGVVPRVWSELTGFCDAAFVGDTYVDFNASSTFDEGDVLTIDLNRNKAYDPSYLRSLANWAKDRAEKWNKAHPDKRIEFEKILESLQKKAEENWQKVTETGLDAAVWATGAIVFGLSGMFFLISYLVLVPVYTFFLLRGMNDIRTVVSNHIPVSHKPRILTILRKIDIAASSFFRGKLIICLIKGGLAALGLYLVGTRFSLLFGIIVAVSAIVPFVVVIVGWLPAAIVSFVDGGGNWWLVGGTLFVFLAVEAIEGAVLTPFILGKETGLHPVTVIISLFVGAELLGLFGVILSIPLACAAKILAQELVMPHLNALSEKQNTTAVS